MATAGLDGYSEGEGRVGVLGHDFMEALEEGVELLVKMDSDGV